MCPPVSGRQRGKHPFDRLHAVFYMYIRPRYCLLDGNVDSRHPRKSLTSQELHSNAC